VPLTADDQRHLTAAEGFAELGMYLDADAELEEIDAEVRHVAEVLAVRLRIYKGLEKWELMRTVAGRLAAHDPDKPQWPLSLAYATRRAQSIEAAKSILLEAVERLPKEPILHYNLACYECQLGELEVAKARLAHAFNLEPDPLTPRRRSPF
jgi:Tfp pilus assembly protein PilF